MLRRLAALVIAVGFAASAVAPHEGDPGLPIVLVPVGGVVLVAGLTRAAWAQSAPVLAARSRNETVVSTLR